MNQNRTVYHLDRGWKFQRGEQEKAWYQGLDDTDWQSVTVPHDWSVAEPFSKEHSSGTGYLPGGIGWYRKEFTLPECCKGKIVRLQFDGVYNNSQVWINSNYLGKRPYGYTSFSYDITEFLSERNTICVKVDHKDIADSRWFTGSGIFRPVRLTVTDPIHICENGVFVTTPQILSGTAVVCAEVRIDAPTTCDVAVTYRILDAQGREAAASTHSISLAAHTADQMRLTVVDPALWSPQNPALYTLKTTITRGETVVDEVDTVFGIRSFCFDADKGFFLNGESQKLKGVCVHHDAGCLGAAVPPSVWERRLRKFKEAGCNAIRTSHNPPDPALLDLCDTMGFLVMDEAFDEWEMPKNKWWQGHNVYPPKNDGYYEDFPAWSERDLKDLIMRDRNHPSIILWSIGNEIDYPNDPYCHPYFDSMTGNNDKNKPASERHYDPTRPNAVHLAAISKRLVGYVKELDTTRPVTSALAFPELSNLTGYADTLDVVGYNYKEHLYEEDHKIYAGRVIYGSENSTSLEAWLPVRDNDYICGQFLWTGIDFLGEAQGWPIRVSQAGLMTTAGFEKPLYYLRKCLWSNTPTVFAAVGTDFHNAQPHWNWKEGESLPILCCTNCEQVELFVNDVSVGSAVPVNQVAAFTVTYHAGSLKAVGSDGTQFVLRTAGAPARLQTALYPIESDIAQIEVSLVDNAGRLVTQDDRSVTVTVLGDAQRIGIENGDPADLQAYNLPYRSTHLGKLIVYIRKGMDSAVVKLESQDLLASEITL